MDIAKQIKIISETSLKEFESDPAFNDLKEFYSKMLQQGLARKQEYSLPLLDTLGLFFKTQL